MSNNNRVERSRSNRVLGGVCAGLADYFNFDVTLMRVLFVVAVMCYSFGFWLYVILWLVLPSENPLGRGQTQTQAQTSYDDTIDITPQDEKTEKDEKKAVNGALIASLVLIFIGFVALADNFLSITWLWKLWPVSLIVIGVVILINSLKNNENGK